MREGMIRPNKWKYLLYFQNEEFNDLISKDIIEILYSNLQIIIISNLVLREE